MITEAQVQSQASEESSLPAAIVIDLNGSKITAPAKVETNRGLIWYEAVLTGGIGEGKTVEDALLGAVASFEGEVVLPGKKNLADNGQKQIVISQPRKYKKGHAKQGQDVPGTGGNPTISFVRMLPSWPNGGYMLRVTVTSVGDNKVRVSIGCAAAVVGRGRTVGTVDAPVSL